MDTSADYHLKIQNDVTILRLAGNVGISDHWGKPKPFSSDCLVTENQKKKKKHGVSSRFFLEAH